MYIYVYWHVSLSSCIAYLCTPMCKCIYFGMNSSVCWVSACAHENNMAQFPFLWTIQLPLSGRLMERGLLDQCHRVSSMPRSLSAVLPPSFASTHPLPNLLTNTYTLLKKHNYVYLHVLLCTLFLTISPHSSFTISHQSVDRIHSDTWQAHQQFSPLTLQTASLQRPKHNLEVT